MPRRTLQQWLAAYSVCHQNTTNKRLHWICVPAIAASLLALLWSLPVPWSSSIGLTPQATSSSLDSPSRGAPAQVAPAPLKQVWKTFSPQSTWLNFSTIVVLGCLIFYLRLSLKMTLLMLLWSAGILGVVGLYERSTNQSVWLPALVVFVVAWIGQFVGHKIEGKKPAFFEDLQYLLIGPLWVLDALERRITRTAG